MTGFFLTPGSPERHARQVEIARREAQVDGMLDARVADVEAMLADDSRDGLRLLELAHLLGADEFRRREEGLAFAAKLRSGPKGNDPSYQRAIMIHDRNARLNPEYPLTKARQILALIQTWTD